MNDTGHSTKHGDPDDAGFNGLLWLVPPPWCAPPRHPGSIGNTHSDRSGNLTPKWKLFVYCDDTVAREVHC